MKLSDHALSMIYYPISYFHSFGDTELEELMESSQDYSPTDEQNKLKDILAHIRTILESKKNIDFAPFFKQLDDFEVPSSFEKHEAIFASYFEAVYNDMYVIPYLHHFVTKDKAADIASQTKMLINKMLQFFNSNAYNASEDDDLYDEAEALAKQIDYIEGINLLYTALGPAGRH